MFFSLRPSVHFFDKQPTIGAWRLVPMAFVLGACSPASDADLQAWVGQQKQLAASAPLAAKSNSVPTRVGASKNHDKASVSASAQMDPFADLNQRSAPAQNTNRDAPDTKRRKESLEAFELSQLYFVGSLQKNGRLVALIRSPSGVVTVQVGSYLGSNHGRIEHIGTEKLTLSERIQTNSGWSRQTAYLHLQNS